MLKVVSAPTSEVITLAELKKHVRVDTADDNSVLETLLKAATEKFEERAMITVRPTGFELTLPGFGSCIDIPAYPLRAVTSISYVDTDGMTQAVSSANYSVVETPEGARIVFNDNWSAPSLDDDVPEPVTIAFEAGYDDPESTEGDLPLKAKIVIAIVMLVGHWYDGGGVADLPFGFESIAKQERIFR